jgi:hypothetical protein
MEGEKCNCHEIMEWNGMEWNHGIMESWNAGII